MATIQFTAMVEWLVSQPNRAAPASARVRIPSMTTSFRRFTRFDEAMEGSPPVHVRSRERPHDRSRDRAG
eukprot:901177-Prymnesium_polylepis.1